jgi:hypothetical protein
MGAWADTGSTDAARAIQISSDTQLTAVYDCNGTSSSSISINSIAGNGNNIFGYYTVLFDGNAIATGFTTKTFPTVAGSTYSLLAASYGSCTFSNWSDLVASNPRTVTATSGPLSFTGVYNCASTTITTAKLNVLTENSAGSLIAGYHATLWQNALQLQSCLTPCSFTLNIGQTYQVAVADYGNEVFDVS